MKNISKMTFNEMLAERIENRKKMNTVSIEEHKALIKRNRKLREAMDKLESQK